MSSQLPPHLHGVPREMEVGVPGAAGRRSLLFVAKRNQPLLDRGLEKAELVVESEIMVEVIEEEEPKKKKKKSKKDKKGNETDSNETDASFLRPHLRPHLRLQPVERSATLRVRAGG